MAYKIGEKYNYFTIVSEVERVKTKNRYRNFVTVKNEFNKEFKIRTDDLKRASTSNEFEHKNFAGEQYGRLKLLNRVEDNDYGAVSYLAECSCGTKTVVTLSSAVSGKTKSCGCLVKDLNTERSSKKFLGKRFGRLVVKSIYENNRNAHIIYECVCDCGNITNVASGNLTNGHTKSCGCLQKEVSARTAKNKVDKYFKPYHEKVSVEKTHLDKLRFSVSDKVRSDNTSGVTGVRWIEEIGKWHARITINGEIILLGNYKDKEEAIIAREEAEKKYFHPILEKYKDRYKEVD